MELPIIYLSIYLPTYLSESKWLNQLFQDPDIRLTLAPDSLPIVSVYPFMLHILDSILYINHIFLFPTFDIVGALQTQRGTASARVT